MKEAVLHKIKKPHTIEDVARLEASSGDVLIKVEARGGPGSLPDNPPPARIGQLDFGRVTS